jgi:hypothetical protein
LVPGGGLEPHVAFATADFKAPAPLRCLNIPHLPRYALHNSPAPGSWIRRAVKVCWTFSRHVEDKPLFQAFGSSSHLVAQWGKRHSALSFQPDCLGTAQTRSQCRRRLRPSFPSSNGMVGEQIHRLKLSKGRCMVEQASTYLATCSQPDLIPTFVQALRQPRSRLTQKSAGI